MRVLIFGVSGMLGHKLYQELGKQVDVFGTIRNGFDSIERFGLFNRSSIIENIDIVDAESLRGTLESVRPDVVINAVGLIKQVPSSNDVEQALSINSIFPHRLADLATEFGFRLITFSTDCVFDGARGRYSESDPPDARDLYGISKLLGEVATGNSLTIRTSIIGRELASHHSIVEWFLGNHGQAVKGYTRAIYSGFPTIVMAEIISDIITRHPTLRGVYHVSSDPISKFDMLNLVNDIFDAGVSIEPDDEYVIDRSLDSARFREATGFVPESWPNMIERMAGDPTPYNSWR